MEVKEGLGISRVAKYREVKLKIEEQGSEQKKEHPTSEHHNDVGELLSIGLTEVSLFWRCFRSPAWHVPYTKWNH